MRGALNSQRALSMLFLQAFLDLIANRLILPRIPPVADEKHIGHGCDAAQIQHANVDRLLFLRRVIGGFPRRVQIFGGDVENFCDGLRGGRDGNPLGLLSGRACLQILLLILCRTTLKSIVRFQRGTCVCLLAACALFAGEAATVRQARENLEQTRKLAEAGAASRKQLEQAEELYRQAQDDVMLAEMLDARIAVEDLTEEQSSNAVAAATRRLDRHRARLVSQSALVAEGVAPRTSLVPLEEEIDRARKIVAAMEDRARSLGEIAAMIRAEEEVAEVQPAEPSIADGVIARITRFQGENRFATEDFKRVILEFEKKFDRKLPVSARGETALHRSMGFDHRGRVDVALNPDGVEGRWLMRFLEQQKIPFFAFRTAVRGQATAPHIHIGPPSARIRFSD